MPPDCRRGRGHECNAKHFGPFKGVLVITVVVIVFGLVAMRGAFHFLPARRRGRGAVQRLLGQVRCFIRLNSHRLLQG